MTFKEGTTLEWRTDDPYQSVIEVSGPNVSVTLRRLNIKHYSKSVANNYAVYLHDEATLILEDCEVESASGSGLGVEGGNLVLRRTR